MDRETAQKQKAEARQKKRDEKARRKAEKLARKEAKKAERRSRPPSALLQEFWNLPNMLTMGRIAVIPLFVWFLSDADPFFSWAAASIFTLAAVTDVIDGFLARRWNMITVVGKLLDPLADKLIVAAALVCREFIVTGLRQIAASEGLVIAAGQEGKWKTSLQLTGIVALCIHYTHPMFFGFAWYDVNFNLVGKFLVYFSTAFSVWSAGVYFQAFLRMLSRRGQPAPGA
jgi:CDP-diacylglycerol--glycerol-3-phosphate 3-phosphatidyltransferase